LWQDHPVKRPCSSYITENNTKFYGCDIGVGFWCSLNARRIVGPLFLAEAVNSEGDVKQMLQVCQSFRSALFLQFSVSPQLNEWERRQLML
jgi:hypothetical protein